MFKMSKSMLRLLIAAAMSLAVMTVTTMAFAETTAKVSYDSAAETITVQLNTDRAEKSAALTVCSERKYYVIAEFERTSKTNFGYTCKLPQNMPSGTYTAVVTIGGESKEVSFSHINQKMAAKALLLVNGADENTFAGIIKTNGAELAVDVTQFTEYESVITQLFFLYRPEGDLTITDFAKLYNKCLLLAELKAETDVEAVKLVLKEEAEALEFDYSAFEALGEDEQAEIAARFQKGVYAEKELTNEYAKWFALAHINAGRDGSVMSYRTLLFDTYADLLLLDTTDYDESADADEVIRLVMDASYDSIEDVQTAFYVAVKQVGKAKKSSGSNSSSSGGGGSHTGSAGGGLVRWSGTTTDTAKTETAKGQTFTDVAAGHWCAQAAEKLAESGILSGMGDGSFLPDRAVTRAEFSKMLLLGLYGEIDAAEPCGFADVAETDWFYDVVSTCKAKGLVTGDASGLFHPNNTISRQDMAVMLARGLADVGYAGTEQDMNFTDETDIADYAKEAVAKLVGCGVLSGMSDGSFKPMESCSRAQAAKALYETLQICGRL